MVKSKVDVFFVTYKTTKIIKKVGSGGWIEEEVSQFVHQLLINQWCKFQLVTNLF